MLALHVLWRAVLVPAWDFLFKTQTNMHALGQPWSCSRKVARIYYIKKDRYTSVVSYVNLGSMPIFASCVNTPAARFADVPSFEYILVWILWMLLG